jgi:hypothetical protein
LIGLAGQAVCACAVPTGANPSAKTSAKTSTKTSSKASESKRRIIDPPFIISPNVFFVLTRFLYVNRNPLHSKTLSCTRSIE